MKNKVTHIRAGDIIYAPSLKGGMTLLCASVDPHVLFRSHAQGERHES